MTTSAGAAKDEEDHEAPHAASVTTSVASSSRIRTPASAPIFTGNKKAATTAGDTSIKSDHRGASYDQRSGGISPKLYNSGAAATADRTTLSSNNNDPLQDSFHSSPHLMNNNSTPQRIRAGRRDTVTFRRDLQQKIRHRGNRNQENNATAFQHGRSGRMQRNNNDDKNNNNEDNRISNVASSSSAPLPKALTDLLLQTAILGIDTTAKLSKPTLELTKNTLLPQIILPLLRELWETYAPDRLQTWMKVVPSSLKNLHELLLETDAGKQFGHTSLQLGEDVVDMVSSEVARQFSIDVTVSFIKLLDALHTPEVRALLDQFAISMCRLVDVMSSGKAKQVWFDVADTIWSALEVGSDEVMVMALAEGCAKVCFALERERESLKRRRRESSGGGGDDDGKSGKVKTEKLIAAARRRKERDQRQLGTYPPGKEVLRNGGGRDGIEEALLDGLGSYTRDVIDQQQDQQEDDIAVDDADQIYLNMSNIVDNNNDDRPPQRVIVPTSPTDAENFPQPFDRSNVVLDRDDESEITTEIEDLRRNDEVVEQQRGNDMDSQCSESQSMVDNQRPSQQRGALAYEDERGDPLGGSSPFNSDAVQDEDENDEATEQYDNFDEPILQFYRRLNDVLSETRKDVKLREALETQQHGEKASSRRAGKEYIRSDEKVTDLLSEEKHMVQSSSPSNNGLFSISKKWWKFLLLAFICGTAAMCLLWVALGCYGFYVIFVAEPRHLMPVAHVNQPIVIQIAGQGSCGYETDKPERSDVASISLDDWNELKRDVDAAIQNTEL